MLRFAVSESVHAQVRGDGTLECGLVRPRAIVAAPGSASHRQKSLVLEDTCRLLYRHDADVEQLRDLVEGADLRARLARQNELAELRGSGLHQLASRDLGHFWGCDGGAWGAGYRSVVRTVRVPVGYIELNRLVGTRNERYRSVMSGYRLWRAGRRAGHRYVHSDDIAHIGYRIK